MKSPVIIKSYQNGISLLLDGNIGFDDIIAEIQNKFSESRTFFGKNKMALSIDGRQLTDKEQIKIIETIQKSSDLEIVCIIGKDKETEQNYLKAIEKVNHHLSDQDHNAQIYKGTVNNNQTINVDYSIIIMGDVYPGSKVKSKHDIIVMGGLYGEAYAGSDGEENHFIAALNLSPQKLMIADHEWNITKPFKWSIKPKIQPKIAYINKQQLLVESITKELLSAL